MDEERFRLRCDAKIVGYSKKIHNSTFFSKDEYGWGGTPIEYTIRDRFTGFFDKNRRPIYINDILELPHHEDCRFAFVVYDEVLNSVQLLNWSDEELVSADLEEFFENQTVVWKSYRFIQNNL